MRATEYRYGEDTTSGGRRISVSTAIFAIKELFTAQIAKVTLRAQRKATLL
jgi:hypothetical protein